MADIPRSAHVDELFLQWEAVRWKCGTLSAVLADALEEAGYSDSGALVIMRTQSGVLYRKEFIDHCNEVGLDYWRERREKAVQEVDAGGDGHCSEHAPSGGEPQGDS